MRIWLSRINRHHSDRLAGPLTPFRRRDKPGSRCPVIQFECIIAQDMTYCNAESLLQQQNSGRPPNVFLGVTRLLHHMGSIFQENSLPQSNPGGIQIDRKRLEQLQEKREAHGLKGNVYEEYKGPTMSM